MYITWVDEYNDKVVNIDYPKGWSAGNTALYLACKYGAEEVYMVGFDGSNYSHLINNIYKGLEIILMPIVVDITRLTGITNLNWYRGIFLKSSFLRLEQI